jgi:beta-lactamase regulating signal transducer with metallopeptidase domain
MNDLGIALICSAFQVTLLGSLVAVLYLFASRRAPAVAARAAALGLGACVVLTLGAVCPLPSWWSWTLLLGRSAPVPLSTPGTTIETRNSSEENVSPSEAADTHSVAENPWMGWSLARLRDVWDTLARQRADTDATAYGWPSIVPTLFVSGVGLALLRLGVGLWSVSRYRRRSRPLAAAAPLDLLVSLQRIVNCPRRIEVRESPDLSTPATIGWRRPLILLPSDWRSWTKEELRAVLAHELAHVRRGDYAAGLLAQISLAIHFYHPLAYWLAGRLQLQQELAADAFGAACLGGRERYLRTLARLLLREDVRPPCWPARTFLSPSGTLLRRIDMLRVKDGSSRQRLPRSATAFLVLVLALSGVGISALRGPARESKEVRADAQETNKDSRSPSADKSARPAPFDLAYVNPDAPGVAALRPGAFLRHPGMRPLAALAKVEVASILTFFGIPTDAALSIETIEQVIGVAQLGHNEKAPKGQRNTLVFGLNMIRTEKDFDWKKFMQALMPDAEEVRYQGKTYYKGKLRALKFKSDFCYFLPDGRTVVLHQQEKTMRRVLDNLAEERRMLPWAGDWQRVERGLAAMAFDSAQTRKIVKDVGPDLAPLIENTTHFVVGVDLNDLFTVQAFAACPDEKLAETLIEWARTKLDEAANDLDQEERDPQHGIADRLARDLLKQARLTQHGTKASLRTHTKITVADLEKMLTSSDMSSK